MSNPHVRQLDRDALEDRGLVDDDRTEMLTAPVNPVAPTTGGSRPNYPVTRKEVR